METLLDRPALRNTTEVWLEMIGAARSSIDLEQFYLANDPAQPLELVVQALIDAAGRGVRIRVLAEARFQKLYPDTLARIERVPRVAVRIIDYGALAGGVQHAKFFIVDGAQVFVGSQNFDWRALVHIHELGLRIRHPEAARFYGDLFELDWQLAEHNDKARLAALLKPQRYRLPIRLQEPGGEQLEFWPVASPRGWLPDASAWDEPRLVQLIDSAQRALELQVLSYSTKAPDSPYTVLDSALRRAAGRGVQVRLIVADWSTRQPKLQHLRSLAQVPNVAIRISTIPPFSGGHVPYARVEHCKYLVVDGTRAWLGTSNWERDYFYETRNVGVILHSPRVAGALHGIFEQGWSGPYTQPLDLTRDYPPPRIGE